MGDVTAASIATSFRRRTAAALAAVAVGAAGLLITLQTGAAAAPRAVALAAPVTTTAGKLTLTVDPAGGLTAAGATLRVAGSGFDTSTGIYVAICHADGKAPARLNDCVGGAIPNGNTSKSWAHISDRPAAPGGSPVAAWGTGGSFSVRLSLPASNSASDGLDCSKVPCAVYTAPDQGSGTAEDLSVPLVYAGTGTASSSAASSTTASSTTPSSTAPSSATSTSPASSTVLSSPPPQFSTSASVVATTVQAKSVRSPTIVAGGVQEVLFAGFAKNEPVSVTLYSAPQSLPAAQADQDGVVKVDFVVPADLAPATHILRVVGQVSKVTGVASFVVTAPVLSSSAVVVASTPVTSSAASSAPVSSVVVGPATLSSASSASTTAPVSSGSAAIAPPAPSGRVVWPWYALGVLLLILAGVLAYLLNRRFRLAVERRDNDALLADAAAAEHERNLDAIARANRDAPTAYLGGSGPGVGSSPSAGGYSGYHPGEHGLLSGRDNPDSPGLLSGTGYRALPPGEQPTTFIPDEQTTFLPPDDQTVQLPGGDQTAAGGPPTGSWRPDFDDSATGGPPTGSWRPDFDDDSGNTSGPAPDEQPPGEQPDDPASGGRHTRPS